MGCEELKKIWLEEEQHAFRGWDFSHLDSRWQSGPLPWDYRTKVAQFLRPFHQLLDMGTGGGEFLRSLGHPHENTSVTEAWPPNIQLCMEKLAPLGIRVYPVEEETPLPIADGSFDIVINRHESYDPGEVRRILKPGGMFITQQVGGQNGASLEERINLEPTGQKPYSLDTELPKLVQCGFCVEYADECHPELQFFDVGAVVFWAKVITWSFPRFSVERNFAKLCALQEALEKGGFVSTLEHRFIIVARNN